MTEQVAPKSKLVRVIMEYEDGTIKKLEGEDPEIWLKDLNRAVQFMQVTRKYMLRDGFLKVTWNDIDRAGVAKLYS